VVRKLRWSGEGTRARAFGKVSISVVHMALDGVQEYFNSIIII
jgi:hypothetical protein